MFFLKDSMVSWSLIKLESKFLIKITTESYKNKPFIKSNVIRNIINNNSETPSTNTHACISGLC